MTADQLTHLVELLDDFIAWLEAEDDPTFDLAALRWTRYLAAVSAKVQRDVQP